MCARAYRWSSSQWNGRHQKTNLAIFRFLKVFRWQFNCEVVFKNLTSSNINFSEVSQFKKKRKEVNTSEVDRWMTNQNALMLKLIQSYREPNEWTFLTKDELFGQVIGKSIAKTPDEGIREEVKIEIQQCILNAKRRVPKS